MGTRTIGVFEDEIGAIAATRRGSRILVVGRSGGWSIVDRKGNAMRSGTHPFVAGLYTWVSDRSSCWVDARSERLVCTLCRRAVPARSTYQQVPSLSAPRRLKRLCGLILRAQAGPA